MLVGFVFRDALGINDSKPIFGETLEGLKKLIEDEVRKQNIGFNLTAERFAWQELNTSTMDFCPTVGVRPGLFIWGRIYETLPDNPFVTTA